MHEVDAPIETSNPSTFGVSEQVAYRGHSEVTMGRPIGIELEKTRPRGGVRIPPNVDYSVLEEALVGRVWNMSRLKAFIFLRMDWVTKGCSSMTSLFRTDQIDQAARGKEELQGMKGRYKVLDEVVDMSLS